MGLAPDLVGQRPQAVLTARDQDEALAARSQATGADSADAARGARDDCSKIRGIRHASCCPWLDQTSSIT
jgi:hypothetical protein